ncbi:MAG: efflux transporter, family, subunit [Proteobacteria bacterium]|nr:efflux transporter, family, subunit [Pseudomonadota bacterium]
MKFPSRRTLAISAVIAAALGGLAWVIASQGPLAPIKVTVAQAKETTLALSVFGIGNVEARRSYNIGPSATGRVTKVLVDQGDKVTVGQLLAEMDPIDQEERMQASQAAADRAAHNVKSAEASVAEAVSRAQIAKVSADRYAELRNKNFISQEAADAKRHEANAAQAARAGAESALAAARDELRRAVADRTGTGKVRAQLRLHSPIDGVVVSRLAEPGSTLVAGETLLQVVDPASLWVRARFDQGRSGGLAVGLPAEVVLRSLSGQILHGKVERVDLVGDAVAEERIANIGFVTIPSGLTIGELAEVNIRRPLVEKTLAIPAAAVKRVGKEAGVWLLQDGSITFRPITIGAVTLEGLVQVAAGLKVGEAVIVHSSQPLSQNMRVKVVDALVRSTP